MAEYQWYDRAGQKYGLTPHQVAAKVRKHNLPKRRIYGHMAVECGAWDRLMLDPVTKLNQQIDRLMSRYPALPAWAAHEFAALTAEASGTANPTTEAVDNETRRLETDWSHSEGAHQ